MYMDKRPIDKTLTRAFPTKVKIGPHRYTIHLEDTIESDGSIGTFLEERGEIHIKSGLSTTLTGETLLHELLHACFVGLGVDGTFGTTDEEVIAAVSAYNLAQIFQDNPSVIKWLLKALES